ncbi:ribonuclease T2 [Saccharomycopsis crataegensis]|uniref:Ribonuclease T2-like n=1 Tax=Saccharomycopsis crataegensis TaxID=43959 RepID=A0AAV5QNT8_9ASCO|nr:ribonuclease T2 [Saccharomycopsis crataegensis]
MRLSQSIFLSLGLPLSSFALQNDLQKPLTFTNPFDNINAPHCPAKTPLSCQRKSEPVDSCCYDDVLFLSTQFWNYYPAIGANDTFTLHGLWPDNCDGSYEQFCDSSMNINNVTEILEQFGEHELLEKMKEVWLNINHNDESLWLHEFNKHATCIDSIKTPCYGGLGTNYQPHQNVVDFFKVTVNLWEKLPTFQWLAEAGIHPSVDVTYTKKQIEEALAEKFGATPFIKCNRFNGIQEIWYFNTKKGSLLEQNFIPLPSLMDGKCPDEGIKFYPKGSLGKEPPRKGGPTRGYVKLDGQDGCLIRSGKWIIGGSCATYYLEDAPFGGHQLKSRNGYCSISKTDGSLICAKNIKPMQFQLDKSTGFLGLNGKESWSTDKAPRKYHYVPVYLGDQKDVKFKLRFDKI